MGALDKLKESLFRIRLVPRQGPEDKTSFVKEKQDLPNQIDNAITEGKRVDLGQLLDILTLKGDRNAKYEIFEEMVADGRIGAAVEMYANDTVQYNSEGKIIWVESKDSDVAKYCNTLLEDLGIPENIWSWAYCMWLYGDVYLETFFTKSQEARNTLLVEPTKYNGNIRTQQHVPGLQIQRYIKKVPNPADIYDLQSYGKTVGYVRNREDIENVTKNNTYFYSGLSTDIDVLSPVKYVHICLSPNINRFPAKFNLIQKEQVTNEAEDVDATTDLTFDVKVGQSVLENVYAPYQSLKLKEDSVLLERITKSSIIRVIQVELGDMPESQKRTKLMELKNQIEQQIQMNKETGTIQSRSGAQPTENIIYTTTKNGKGAISTVNIGGDVDIGNLSDLESSENKLYGSLLIPKGLLGADMEGCLAGSTELLLLNGQTRTIKYITEHIDEYLGKGIMSCNEDGTLIPTTIINAKLTRKNAITVRVHLDNGTYIDATPDHLFMMRDGSFKEAQDLQYLDSLMPYYDYIKNGRRYVLDNKTGVIKPQYRLVAETKYGKLDRKGYQVHHINSIKIDDDFDNLEYISSSEHCKKHHRMLHATYSKAQQQRKKYMNPEEYSLKYGKGGRASSEIQKWKRENLPEWRKHEHNAKSKARKNWLNEHPEWLEKTRFTSEYNPMNNPETIERMRQTQLEKYRTDVNYKNTAIKNILKGQKISTQHKKERAEKLIRNCRCFRCNKIFRKRLTDAEYINYLNKRKLVICGKDCNYLTPCFAKISNSIRLWLESNSDLETYVINKYSGQYGRADKYSNPEVLMNILEIYNKYTPEVKNHKVVNIEWIDEPQNTYDIEVANKSHTFLLKNGIFVHNSGLSNGGSLTEMNTTYARRIKRGQIALCAAIKTLINIFALAEKNGDKIVNNFEVKLTPILTIEDTRRDEILQKRVSNVNDLLNMVDSFESIEEKTKLDMLIEWLSKYLNQQDIVDILNDAIKESDKSLEDKIEEKDRENDDTFDFDVGHSSDEFTASVDRDSVVEPLDDINAGESGGEESEPELAPSEPLADIEGQDLL